MEIEVEVADEFELECPACDGRGCHVCDMEGTVVRWVEGTTFVTLDPESMARY